MHQTDILLNFALLPLPTHSIIMRHKAGVSRRHVLASMSGLGVAISGCLTQGDDSSPTSNESQSGSPTATPTPTVVNGVEVPPCPDRPDSFTRATVRQFAFQFEKAYDSQETVQGRDDIVSFDVDIVESDENVVVGTDDGWIVRFEVIGPKTQLEDGLHGDPSWFRAHYLIVEDGVFRAVSLDDVDPQQEGTEVQCPPE